ncbi:MAG: HYR domain-containing protein, partial [Flavobacteriia bacterium]|nr:HYR domain-containing protein [Flavobacteriia bacterium]
MKKKLLLQLLITVFTFSFGIVNAQCPGTDSVDPVILPCPGVNQTVNTDPGVCTYTKVGVDWDFTATDEDDFGNPTFGIITSYVVVSPLGVPSVVATLNGFVFTKGTSTVIFNATDACGNSADACQFTVTVIDNQVPTISCVGNQTVSTDAGLCTYRKFGVGWNATGTDNCTTIFSYVLTGATTGSGASLNNKVFNKGVTTVTWTVNDGSGHTATCSFTVTVNDTENPVITCPGNQSVSGDAGLCTYTKAGTSWNATATDNCSSITYSYVLTGATIGSGSTLNGVTFNSGVTTVTWTANDGSAFTVPATCVFTVTVSDTEAPAISCVGNQSVSTDPGVCIYTIIGAGWNATGSDNCGAVSFAYVMTGATTGSGSSLSGIELNKGVTTITWTATDGVGLTSTCSYTVTVSDTELPTISCVGNRNVNTDAGVCTFTKVSTSWNATGADNCSTSFSYVLTGATTGSGASLAGVVFNGGVTTVTWTVNDGSGNTATCSFTVTVTDNQDPTISCAAVGNQTVNTDAGVCTYTKIGASWNPSASDNCSFTLTYALTGATVGAGSNTLNGVTFNQGLTTVTWTVNDGTRPVQTCSYTVTVVDAELPVISCAAVGNQTVNTNASLCTYTKIGTGWNVVGTDNCSATTTYTLTGVTVGSGSSLAGVVFNKGVTTVTWSVTDGVNPAQTCSY